MKLKTLLKRSVKRPPTAWKTTLLKSLPINLEIKRRSLDLDGSAAEPQALGW
jgi:hypothetical protein